MVAGGEDVLDRAVDERAGIGQYRKPGRRTPPAQPVELVPLPGRDDPADLLLAFAEDIDAELRSALAQPGPRARCLLRHETDQRRLERYRGEGSDGHPDRFAVRVDRGHHAYSGRVLPENLAKQAWSDGARAASVSWPVVGWPVVSGSLLVPRNGVTPPAGSLAPGTPGPPARPGHAPRRRPRPPAR